MRIVPADLKIHFGKSKRTFCFAWQIRRAIGGLLLLPEGFTSHDKDLTIDGVTYRSTANASPTSFPFSIGVPNSALEAVLLFDGAAFVEDDVALGRYDAAKVQLFVVNWADTSQFTTLFGGTLGKPSYDNQSATFELNPESAALNEEMGRVFSPRCPYARFGRGPCRNGADVGGLSDGPDIAAFTKTATVSEVTSAGRFKIAGISLNDLPDSWSAFGVVRFESGGNASGEFDIVKQTAEADGEVEIWLSMPAIDLPEIGDLVSLEKGCNRTPTACDSNSNYANYGGFDNFPLSEGLNSVNDS